MSGPRVYRPEHIEVAAPDIGQGVGARLKERHIFSRVDALFRRHLRHRDLCQKRKRGKRSHHGALGYEEGIPDARHIPGFVARKELGDAHSDRVGIGCVPLNQSIVIVQLGYFTRRDFVSVLPTLHVEPGFGRILKDAVGNLLRHSVRLLDANAFLRNLLGLLPTQIGILRRTRNACRHSDLVGGSAELQTDGAFPLIIAFGPSVEVGQLYLFCDRVAVDFNELHLNRRLLVVTKVQPFAHFLGTIGFELRLDLGAARFIVRIGKGLRRQHDGIDPHRFQGVSGSRRYGRCARRGRIRDGECRLKNGSVLGHRLEHAGRLNAHLARDVIQLGVSLKPVSRTGFAGARPELLCLPHKENPIHFLKSLARSAEQTPPIDPHNFHRARRLGY